MIHIKISRFLGLAASAAFLLLIAGCGYSFTPTGEHIATRVKTVFVDNFSNRSSEAYVETYLRKAFIDEFIKGRRFKVVGKPETADAVLKGSVKNLTTSHLAYDINNISIEERVTMTMDIIFEEQETHTIIWSGKNISGIEDYKIAAQIATESSRKDALIKLANNTAEKVYRLMMSGF